MGATAILSPSFKTRFWQTLEQSFQHYRSKYCLGFSPVFPWQKIRYDPVSKRGSPHPPALFRTDQLVLLHFGKDGGHFRHCYRTGLSQNPFWRQMYPDHIREKIHFQGFLLADLYPDCIVQYLFRGDWVDHRYELFRYYDIYQLVYQTQKHIFVHWNFGCYNEREKEGSEQSSGDYPETPGRDRYGPRMTTYPGNFPPSRNISRKIWPPYPLFFWRFRVTAGGKYGRK